MSEPLISVVIPSYNHERYLREALASARAQSIHEIEIIVIDDGSSDGSHALALQIAAEDARVRVHRQENQGSHAALNRGIELAGGAWLTALNSDDRWHPRRLERMLREAANARADFLFSDVQLIDDNGRAEESPSHWWNALIQRYRDRVAQHGLSDGLLYGNLTVSTSNFLFNREVWERVGPFRPYRYNLDWDFVMRCMLEEGLRVHYVRERLLDYRLHGSNTILGGMPVAALEVLEIARRLQRQYFHVPDGLMLSMHRHERLLRRFMSDKAARATASEKVITDDRDRLESILVERQKIIEHEREAKAREAETLVGRVVELGAELDSMRDDRDRLQALLVQRQTLIERERDATARSLEELSEARRQERVEMDELISALDSAASRGASALMRAGSSAVDGLVDVSGQRSNRPHESITSLVRTIEKLSQANSELRDDLAMQQRLREDLDAMTHQAHRALDQYYSKPKLSRIWDAVRGRRPVTWELSSPAEFRSEASGQPTIGRVRELGLDDDAQLDIDKGIRVNVHLHLYYLDLAEELLGYVRNVGRVRKLIITGPWSAGDIEPYLPAVRRGCDDIVVAQIPNRGKDVGGFIHAVTECGLLDCDYVLKLHSKKSNNPDSYFEAISHLFGTRISDGDQWRRLIIDPIAGSAARVAAVLSLFDSDPCVGMLGAGQFITTAPDINANLYDQVCKELNAAPGLPFIAGTMFWVKASALAGLIAKAPGLSDFDLDSIAVEGGLEHIFERAFGSLVLSQGFDLVGVR